MLHLQGHIQIIGCTEPTPENGCWPDHVQVAPVGSWDVDAPVDVVGVPYEAFWRGAHYDENGQSAVLKLLKKGHKRFRVSAIICYFLIFSIYLTKVYEKMGMI